MKVSQRGRVDTRRQGQSTGGGLEVGVSVQLRGCGCPRRPGLPQGKKQVNTFGSWSEFLNLMFDTPVGSPGSCVQGVVDSVCCWTHVSACWLYMRFWEGVLLLFFKIIYLFIFGAALGLHCYSLAFSSCSE